MTCRLLAEGPQPHFIGYDVLVMGLQGRRWNDSKVEEKSVLCERFDAIKAAAVSGQSEWVKAIDFFEVVERRLGLG